MNPETELKHVQGCGKGCDNMSALVVVLKHFSPFSSGDKEVDLASLPPPPAPEELHPMFLGDPQAICFISLSVLS